MVAYFNILIVFICSLGLAVMYCLNKRTDKKIIYMMTPSINATYDQTYCLLSVLQLKLVKIALAIIALTPILISVEVFMGSAYLDYFYTYAQQNCLEWSWYSYSVGQWLEMLCKLLADQIMILINLLQIFEWKAILYLIETQKNRTCAEILYDHNNENLYSRD